MLRVLIGSALRSSTVDGAVDVWSARFAVTDSLGFLVDQVLDTYVLVEQSKPRQETLEQTAMKVAGSVGVAVTGAAMGVLKAAAVTGVVFAIAGSAGVVLVGVAATLIVYRLLTRRR